MAMSTDRDWQRWGDQDPYFAVLTQEQFRRGNLTPDFLEEFFASGRDQAGAILEDCRRYLGGVSTRYTLEFGCGVGRLLIPFAKISELCVGVDVSDAMREEAGRNCATFGAENVRLVKTLGDANKVCAGFTFAYSYMVLQHVDPRRGLNEIETLLAGLPTGGCAALHVTFGHAKYASTLGRRPIGRVLMRNIRRPFSRLSRSIRSGDPEMQMNSYDMNRLLFLAHQHGFGCGGYRFTDHFGHLGVIVYLKRE